MAVYSFVVSRTANGAKLSPQMTSIHSEKVEKVLYKCQDLNPLVQNVLVTCHCYYPLSHLGHGYILG